MVDIHGSSAGLAPRLYHVGVVGLFGSSELEQTFLSALLYDPPPHIAVLDVISHTLQLPLDIIVFF